MVLNSQLEEASFGPLQEVKKVVNCLSSTQIASPTYPSGLKREGRVSGEQRGKENGEQTMGTSGFQSPYECHFRHT
jgi:hypothetical protein